MTQAAKRAVTGTAEVFRMLGDGTARLVSIFGSLDERGQRYVRYLVDVGGREYRMFSVPVEGPIRSATSATPAAAWYERELHDQFGIDIDGHPDLRPLVFHENWPEGVHPLAGEIGDVPWARGEYRFLSVDGVGVCEVPVGPVHAGIIEPGHFRFSVVGDTIVHLELRHFWTHKGTERLFQGRPAASGSLLAESVSGDNCFAHAVAYCQAVETACDSPAPPRAESIRLVGQEMERLLAHIGDVGALCGDIGFSVPAVYAARLKENLLRESAEAVGTRYWRGISIPGGVSKDISSAAGHRLRQAVTNAGREFGELAQMILDTPSVQNRFETTGILKTQIARELAVVGPVARASGISLDVRLDHPYGAYRGRRFEPAVYHYGDVHARARVRIDEAKTSVMMLEEVLEQLPAGDIVGGLDLTGERTGFSAVESPRGELLYWLEIRGETIRRCHIKSPSFQNWPALPHTMPGNIIADFPLINKSFNLSYSGCDR